jgi:transcriptional adapter 3
VYFGVFSERLVAALVAVEAVDPMELDQDMDQDDDQTLPGSDVPESGGKDLGAFEERVKMELRYLGIIGEDEGVQVPAREQMAVSGRDDEICRELMEAQEKLKVVMMKNNARKDKVAEVVKKWMAYQEFNSILDEGDKQIEIVYARRYVLRVEFFNDG